MPNTPDVDQAVKEIVEVLRKHNIPNSGVDYMFERVKALVHENMRVSNRTFQKGKENITYEKSQN